jgi:hypothetical protein
VPDLPNTRCQLVTIGGLSGVQCLDTINFSIVTTFVGSGKTYAVSGSSKRLDQDIYQHVVYSLTLIS